MACGNKIGAQKVTPMKLKQFPAHAIEPLQSSGAQQGISCPWSAMVISTEIVVTADAPTTGAVATDMEIRKTEIMRTMCIRHNYR